MDGTQQVVPFGLLMGTFGLPAGGGKIQNIRLVMEGNPHPPPGLDYLALPDLLLGTAYVQGIDIVQPPMQPRANVIFLGACGSFSLPFQYWFNVSGATRNHVLIVPSDLNFSGQLLPVPGGVARFEWTLIAQDLAKGKTVAQAVKDANQSIHAQGLFTKEDGTPLTVPATFNWIVIGDANLKLRPTSQ